MPAEYWVDVRYRWWFMPLLKLLLKFGISKKGKFGKGMTSAEVVITGNPSVEILFNS